MEEKNRNKRIKLVLTTSACIVTVGAANVAASSPVAPDTSSFATKWQALSLAPHASLPFRSARVVVGDSCDVCSDPFRNIAWGNS